MTVKIILDKDALFKLFEEDVEFVDAIKDSVLRELLSKKLDNFLTEEANKIFNNHLGTLLKESFYYKDFDGLLAEQANKVKTTLINVLQKDKQNPSIELVEALVKKDIDKIVTKENINEKINRSIEAYVYQYLKNAVQNSVSSFFKENKATIYGMIAIELRDMLLFQYTNDINQKIEELKNE